MKRLVLFALAVLAGVLPAQSGSVAQDADGGPKATRASKDVPELKLGSAQDSSRSTRRISS